MFLSWRRGWRKSISKAASSRTQRARYSGRFGFPLLLESLEPRFAPSVTLSPSSLPGGQVFAPYNQLMSASGGTAPYSFAETAGSLPAGLSLDPGGDLFGTPTTAGNYSFTVTGTDSAGARGSQAYTVFISPALTITTTVLSDWTVNQPGYLQILSASGAVGGLTFSTTAGALPPGLTLNSTGMISGTPSAVGTYSFTVTATDAFGASASQAYTVTISAPITPLVYKDPGPPKSATQYTLNLAGPNLQLLDSSSNVLVSQPLANTSDVDITGNPGGNNTLLVDFSSGVFTIPGTLNFDGVSAGILAVNGGGASGSYTPSATAGSGEVVLGPNTMDFHNVGSVEMFKVLACTVIAHTATDSMTTRLTNLPNSGTAQPAVAVSGASGFTPIYLYNAGTLDVNTPAASNDTVDVAGVDFTKASVTNFTLNTGSGGTDAITFDSGTTTLAGNLTVSAVGNITASGSIATPGDVTLTATTGAISETGSAIISAALLTTDSATGTTLDNTNTLGELKTRNTNITDVYAIDVTDSTVSSTGTTPLIIDDTTIDGSGTIRIRTTGGITVSGSITSTAGDISLYSSGMSDNVVLQGSIVSQSGNVNVETGSDLSLQDGSIATSANVTLTSDTGSISETGIGSISAALLTTSSSTGTTLDGDNSCTDIKTKNTNITDVYVMRVTNTASPLTILGMSAGGSITVNNTGPVIINGAVQGHSLKLGTANGGVETAGSGNISATGGDVEVTAQGGSGIQLDAGSSIATSGSGNISLIADALSLDPTARINAGPNRVTVAPDSAGTSLNLGSANSGVSGVVDMDEDGMNDIVAGTIVFGSSSGMATFSSINVVTSVSRSAATDVQLLSAGDVVFSGGQVNTGGGTLLLQSGPSPAAVRPTNAGTDATASKVSCFVGSSSGSTQLAIELEGNTVDSQYTQLNVSGAVNLSGFNLALAGSYVPVSGDVFTIVSASSVVGTFNGLSDGSLLLFNCQELIVHYTSSAVTLTPLGPQDLLVTAPSTATAGAPFNVTVTATDSAGHIANGYSGPVTLSCGPSGQISPTTVTLVNGTATTSVILTAMGIDTITAAATGLTSATAAVSVGSGVIGQYLVSALTGGAAVTAGNSFLVQVQAADPYGNPITSAYTGPSLVTVNASSGGNTFPTTVALNSTGLGFALATLTAAGTYSLSASAGSLGTVTPASVTVVPAAACKLAFSAPPTDTPTGIKLGPVTVAIEDQFGNLETGDSSDAVVVSVASGPGVLGAGGGTVFQPGSTTTVTATGGLAVFNNLTLIVPGTYALGAVVPGKYTGPLSPAFATAPLQVVPGSFAFSPSGFSLQFNTPLLVTSTTPVLYGPGFGPTAPYPSVTLTQIADAAGKPIPPVSVQGSVVLNPDKNRLTFLATDTVLLQEKGIPILPDGVYQVVLSSSPAHDGFQALNAGGGFLDGTNSGTPGHDFVATFTINATAAGDDVVFVSATADGPRQELQAPGNNFLSGTGGDQGYPVYIADHTGAVTSVNVTFNYNPALLTVTGVTSNSQLPGSTFTLNTSLSSPGHAVLTYTDSGANSASLKGSHVALGFIKAVVPDSSTTSPIYNAEDLLRVSGIIAGGGAIPTVEVDALHLVAYVGDADGNAAYSSNDAVLITRAVLSTDTGFAAYPLADPVIVADTDGDGFLPSDAALQANEAGVAFSTANLARPPIPLPGGPATHLVVLESPLAVTAGGSVLVNLIAEDASNNLATSLNGPVSLVASDGGIFPVTLTNGTATVQVTLTGAGSQTITATDVAQPMITGTGPAVMVNAGPASKLLVSAPTSAAAGTAFLFTVTAVDAYNNPVAGFNGVVSLSSTDPAANLQATTPLTDGTGSFAADFNTTGTQTVNVTELGHGLTGAFTIGVSGPTSGAIPAQVYNGAEAIYGSALTTNPGGSSQDTGGMVFLSDGESYQVLTGPEIVGRGMNYQFTAYYRSGVQFSGPLGSGWALGDSDHLRVVTASNLAEMRLTFTSAKVGDVALLSDNHADLFVLNADGSYMPPGGVFATFIPDKVGQYQLRDRYGNIRLFNTPDARGIAAIASRSDREGNTITYQYNAQGQLSSVTDTLGRPITYSYDSSGRLTDVTDFAGRDLHFTYDASGNLASMTDPPITGTPNGNDFPQGATTKYTYSSGFADPLLNHELLTVTQPNETAVGGRPSAVLTYDTNSASPTAGRVQTLTLGGTGAQNVPAGGTITYTYQTLAAAVPGDITTRITQTTVTDRNGNLTQYQFNSQQNVVVQTEFNNRPMRSTDPPSYVTTYTYDTNYQMLQEVEPQGNTIKYVYDASNPNPLSRGNLLSTTEVPDAARGGDQAAITTTYTYEPIYNQVHTMTEPRGNDPSYVPQNGGVNSPARYTTTYTYDYQEGTNFAALGQVVGMTAAQVQAELSAAGIAMGIGDLDGDGPIDRVAGNVIRTLSPTVTLLPGSNEAIVKGSTSVPTVFQPDPTLYSYNQYGQLTQTVDPEGNVTVYQYYPAQAPSGDGVIVNPSGDPVTGGYLAQTIEDAASAPGRDSSTNPPPANIRTTYHYDAVGNVTREIDGRGIETDYVYNAWDKVVQITSAAAVNVLPPTVAEPMPLTAFGYVERYFYDYNGNTVLSQVEDYGNTSGAAGSPPTAYLPPTAPNPNPSSAPPLVDTVYQYDILNQRTLTLSVIANGASMQLQITRYRYDPDGNQVLVILPEGNATSAVYDDRNLLFQSTVGATAAPPSVQNSPSDPSSYDVRGGIPATTTYSYDLNGNEIQEVDPNGFRTRYIYDGFDRRTARVDGVGNETVSQYDPDGNVIRVTDFGPSGGPSPTSDGPAVLPQPVSLGGVIQSQNLVNSNLLSATETLYDERNRPIQSEQVLFVNSTPTVRPPDVAEGGSDVGLSGLTPSQTQAIPGISGVTILGRVTTRTEYDANSRPTFVVQDDGNTTRISYDGAGRVIQTQDGEGNTVQTAYDADSNVIETRQTDVSQFDGSSQTFITTLFYDSLNRLQQQVDNLGETTYYRYDSRDNLVATADASGLPGPDISRRAFAPGPQTVNTTNLPGNVTLYYYDGLDRQVCQETILTASGQGDGVNIGADINGVKGPTPPPDPHQGGGDGIIRAGTVYDANSLPTARLDDQGNVTLYLYDNLNRQVVESDGLTVNSTLTSDTILGKRAVPTPKAATISSPTFIATADINNQLTEAQARIKAVSALFASLANSVVAPQTTIAGYDPNGDVLISIDPNNSEVFAKYDNIDRLIADRIFRVNQNDSFTGDPIFAPAPTGILANPMSTAPAAVGTTAQNFQYDGLSRRTLSTDNNDPTTTADGSTVTDAYDSLGRVIEESQTIGTQKPLVVSSAWRAEDLRSRLTYPNGQVETYTYDHADRVKTISDSGQNGQPTPAVSTTYDYIGGGSRMAARISADASEYVTYEGMGRPVSVFDDGPVQPSLIVAFTYTYDRMGNKLSQQQLTSQANSEVYSYNSAYQLVTFQRPPGGLQPLQSSWSLDGAGNPSAVNGATQQFSSSNELTQTSTGAAVQYDANGNEINDGTYGYTYDAANRLRTVTAESTHQVIAVYAYDALGRRIDAVVNLPGTKGQTIYFAYDGAQDIQDTSSTGASQTYVFGALGEPLVMTRPTGQRLFYHENASDSVYALTTSAGDVVESYQYEAYGRQTVIAGGAVTPGGASTVGNPYLFVGMRLDGETNLYYEVLFNPKEYQTGKSVELQFGSSYYNPVQNRSLVQRPGMLGDSVNAYAYADDNPVNTLEPAALDFVSRLMEEEGIYYYFKHEDGKHTLVAGDPQTAVVVGPTGDEIYTDKYGRVKVQFFWDRQGKEDEKSSCWVRVAQSWGGKSWGIVNIPRIDQEVIVDFLEGDPDRPLIIGGVSNGALRRASSASSPVNLPSLAELQDELALAATTPYFPPFTHLALVVRGMDRANRLMRGRRASSASGSTSLPAQEALAAELEFALAGSGMPCDPLAAAGAKRSFLRRFDAIKGAL